MNSQKNIRLVDICAYVKCNNGRHRGHHLYSFPEEDNPLYKEWISRIGNPALQYYTSSTLRSMGICADHFLPEMFKPNLTKNANQKRKLKKDAIPEPPKNLLTNEEKEDVQASQLVIKEQLMREEGEEEEERHQHHHYHYQQQQEAEETEVDEERENELFIDKLILKHAKVPFKFFDKEDFMQWLPVKSQTNCDVQLENSTRKAFEEMKLENECTQLLKKNKDLKIQINNLKRKFNKIRKSRNRFRQMLREIETTDEQTWMQK